MKRLRILQLLQRGNIGLLPGQIFPSHPLGWGSRMPEWQAIEWNVWVLGMALPSAEDQALCAVVSNEATDRTSMVRLDHLRAGRYSEQAVAEIGSCAVGAPGGHYRMSTGPEPWGLSLPQIQTEGHQWGSGTVRNMSVLDWQSLTTRLLPVPRKCWGPAEVQRPQFMVRVPGEGNMSLFDVVRRRIVDDLCILPLPVSLDYAEAFHVKDSEALPLLLDRYLRRQLQHLGGRPDIYFGYTAPAPVPQLVLTPAECLADQRTQVQSVPWTEHRSLSWMQADTQAIWDAVMAEKVYEPLVLDYGHMPLQVDARDNWDMMDALPPGPHAEPEPVLTAGPTLSTRPAPAPPPGTEYDL